MVLHNLNHELQVKSCSAGLKKASEDEKILKGIRFLVYSSEITVLRMFNSKVLQS